jgi:hypothetical protein
MTRLTRVSAWTLNAQGSGGHPAQGTMKPISARAMRPERRRKSGVPVPRHIYASSPHFSIYLRAVPVFSEHLRQSRRLAGFPQSDRDPNHG